MDEDEAPFSEEEFLTWVPIARASKTLEQHWPTHVARRAILTALKYQELKARAETLRFAGETFRFDVVPSDAWDDPPDIGDAFWQTGGITSVTDNLNIEYSCFRIRVDPVGFAKLVPEADPEGVDQVLIDPGHLTPAPAIPRAAKNKTSTGWKPPTEEEFNTWLRPREVLGLLDGDYGNRKRAVLAQLREGLIFAVAQTGPPERSTDGQMPFQRIPTMDWKLWDERGPNYFWETGHAEFDMYGAYGIYGDLVGFRRFFHVRFDPSNFAGTALPSIAIDTIPTDSSTPQPSKLAVPEAPKSKGGRPPKEYWEDLIIAMMIAWAEGTFKPKRQADVTREMMDWLEANLDPDKEKWSETPVKERAAKVFQAIRKSDDI